MATDYDIAHISGTCSISQRVLEPGEAFFAVLFETAEGFVRRDFSLEVWNGPPEGVFSFWKSRIPHKEEKRRLLVDNEVLVNLFLRLADHPEPVKQHFRFVLALVLMRKRLLKYEQTVREGTAEYWQMRLTAEHSVHQVRNPRLDDRQIEAVSSELGAILHGDCKAFAQLDDRAESESQSSSDQSDPHPHEH